MKSCLTYGFAMSNLTAKLNETGILKLDPKFDGHNNFIKI